VDRIGLDIWWKLITDVLRYSQNCQGKR